MGQGEVPVGRSVKTAGLGVREVANEAVRVGSDAAALAVEIADRKLAEGAAELAKVRRAAGKDLAKSTRRSRKDIRANSVAAREEMLTRMANLRDPGKKAASAAAAMIESAGDSGRRRRKNLAGAKKDLAQALTEAKSAARGERGTRARWPWLLGLGLAGAAVAFVLRAKRQNPMTEAATETAPKEPVRTDAPEAVTPVQPTAPAKPAVPEKPAAPVQPAPPEKAKSGPRSPGK